MILKLNPIQIIRVEILHVSMEILRRRTEFQENPNLKPNIPMCRKISKFHAKKPKRASFIWCIHLYTAKNTSS